MKPNELSRKRPLQFSLRTLVLLTLLAAAVAYYFGRHLNVSNFNSIEPGMSKADVERLLGGPPGHYGRKWGPGRMTLEGFIPRGHREVWTDDNTMLEVAFDEDMKVVAKHRRARFERRSLLLHWLERRDF